jgi:prepilin-type N-terminal cleavage/methylation domain-containing protein
MSIGRQHNRAAGAFTLVEVLIALGIFAIGMVAVASVFPSAAILQKQAVLDARAKQDTRSAEAMFVGKGLKQSELTFGTPYLPDDKSLPGSTGQTYFDRAFDVFSFAEILTNTDLNRLYPIRTRETNINNRQLPPSGNASDRRWLLEKWPLEDRSFPSSAPLNDLGTDKLTNVRDVTAVPLIRRTNVFMDIPNWQVYVFVLLREQTRLYPKYGDGPSAVASQIDQYANPDDDDYTWHFFDDGANPDTEDLEDKFPLVARIGVSISPTNPKRFTFDGGFDNDFDNDGEVDQIRVGDLVLDSAGVVHNVVNADAGGFEVSADIEGNSITGRDPDFIYYAQPAILDANGNGVFDPGVDTTVSNTAAIMDIRLLSPAIVDNDL